MGVEFLTNQEILQQARKNLEQGPWNYLVGGVESETTMRRNRLAFDKIAFRPRVLVDVSKIDTSVRLQKNKLRIPVILAPMGSLQVFTAEGAAAATKAAGDFGTIHVVSSVTEPSLEQIAETNQANKLYQLYIHGDWDWVKDKIERIKNAGYTGLCITVDSAYITRRERPMLIRYKWPTQKDPVDPIWMSQVTWESLAKIKKEWGKPLLVKGIMTEEDAKIAVDCGVDVVWVSNHGGRQLDYGQGTMEFLPEIVDAVRNKAEIVLDGGVLRGSDVIKALALGANAVAIGKLQGWGLAADGKSGLIRTLEILEAEIKIAMGLLGITSFEQLSTSYVCKADAVNLPNEMSTWPHIPRGRIL